MRKPAKIIDGRRWISISRAAKLLGTNAQGVRKMMGDGRLDWHQPRANARLVVDEAMVNQLRLQRPRPRALRTPDPLASPPRAMPERRARGGLWIGHHLRMTLPGPEEANRKKKPE